jgi:hypothetical protein
MVIVYVGGGKALGIFENSGMEGKDHLEIRVYQGCFNFLNGMELVNDARMAFSK